MVHCAVMNCRNRSTRHDNQETLKALRFFSIPSVIRSESDLTRRRTERRRAAWLARINRKDLHDANASISHTVCSDHFVSGAPAALHQEDSPDWAPSINMGYAMGYSSPANDHVPGSSSIKCMKQSLFASLRKAAAETEPERTVDSRAMKYQYSALKANVDMSSDDSCDIAAPSSDSDLPSASVSCSLSSPEDIKSELSGDSDSDSDISVEEPPAPDLPVPLKVVDEAFSSALPASWLPIVDQNGVHCLCISRGSDKAVQRQVSATFQGALKVLVHCKPLHSALHQQIMKDNVVHPLLQPEDLTDFVGSVLKIVDNVRVTEVCVGADPKRKYIESWKTYENAVVDNNPYLEARFSKTLRSINCTVLVRTVSTWKCKSCMRLSSILSAKKEPDDPVSSSFRPNSTLSVEQLLTKLECQQKEISTLRGRLTRALNADAAANS